ncbi:MAG TPA: hypothetical protein VME18_04375 [Acidobacteriaceae bacterium]|nr:hypothetical protein [Acidobacteriaceae bacterium]
MWLAPALWAPPAPESAPQAACAIEGRRDQAFALDRWFLRLLRMDTVPKFIQLI